MDVLLEADTDPRIIAGETVAIVGFGNQGAAHAANLRDRGVSIIVGARAGTRSGDQARDEGFEVRSVAEAVSASTVIMNLLPDEVQAEVHGASIGPNLKKGAVLAFGHGFSIRFQQIHPPADTDVILVAPVGPGHLLRRRFVEGGGIPCLIAVHQDPSGRGRSLALSYAAALGSGRAGILETTFEEECETDLFGEQTVIVGGVSELITAGFETLVEAGYPEELAYFECAHQMKLLVDLIHEHGIAGMRKAISNTARYGDLTRGPRIIDASVKARMKKALAEIQSGAFAEEWTKEHASGGARLAALTDAAAQHPIERIGARLRALIAKKAP
jgi:ketol-acid reductoisomerase